MLHRHRAIRAAAVGAALLAPLLFVRVALADDPAPPPPPAPIPMPGEAPKPAAPSLYTAAQLKELVGPVALYPDVVLANLLPATTVPTDVLAAARYVEQQGGKTAAVPPGTTWDQSVQALLQFPDVLRWMSENLDWL